MTRPEWLIRPGRDGDDQILASFTCADHAFPWQVEVEGFIQKQLLHDWALAPGAADDDPRLLLGLTAQGELFGVAAHEKVILRRDNGRSFAATKIEVVAISTAWQGRRFASGERASDVLMSAVMTDVTRRIPPRDVRVFAIVHEDNHRSLSLLRRHGLVDEMSRPHPQYRRPITPQR